MWLLKFGKARPHDPQRVGLSILAARLPSITTRNFPPFLDLRHKMSGDDRASTRGGISIRQRHEMAAGGILIFPNRCAIQD